MLRAWHDAREHARSHGIGQRGLGLLLPDAAKLVMVELNRGEDGSAACGTVVGLDILQGRGGSNVSPRTNDERAT